MPNFTKADARKHNSSLGSAEQGTWASIANSAWNRCISKKMGNCDGYSIRVANGVIKKNREEVDFILTALNSSHTETQEEIQDFLYRTWVPEVFEGEHTTPSRLVLPDGTPIEVLEEAAHLHLVHETFSLPATPLLTALESVAPPDIVRTILEAKQKDPTQRTVVYRAIQGRNQEKGESGISANKNFYSGQVAEALAPLLLERRKMYLDHMEAEKLKLGRPLLDLAGIILQSWANGGASFVQTQVLEKEKTGWIWPVMEHFPQEIGVSIHSFTAGRKGR